MKFIIVASLLFSSAIMAGPHPSSIIYNNGAIDSTNQMITQVNNGDLLGALGILVSDYPNFSNPKASAKDDAWRVFRSFTTRRK